LSANFDIIVIEHTDPLFVINPEAKIYQFKFKQKYLHLLKLKGGNMQPNQDEQLKKPLEQFGTDLTALAHESKLDPVIGQG